MSEVLERAAGIEPASPAWKAGVLPLHNARVGAFIAKPAARRKRPQCGAAQVPRKGKRDKNLLWPGLRPDGNFDKAAAALTEPDDIPLSPRR